MGDVHKALFGGTDPTEMTGREAMTGPQLYLLNMFSRQIADQMGQGIEPYGGQIAPGAAPLQTQSFDVISKLLGQAGGAGGVLEGILGQYDPTSARETWEARLAPAMREFKTKILPEVLEPFAGTGALRSGAAGRAAGEAGAQMGMGLSRQLADLIYGGEQAHLGRQAQLAMPSIAMPLELGLQAGGTQRGIEADILGEGFQKWQMSQPWANPWLQQAPTAFGAQPYAFGQTGGGVTGAMFAPLSTRITKSK